MDFLKVSKYLSLILRHKPETIGIKLDSHGWANVNEILYGVSKSMNISLDFDTLKYIVDTDNKGRYSFNEDMTKIRANQGHSVNVDVELEECVPPNILYHGTAEKYVKQIEEQGLIPKSRLYVHLSSDLETALNVGNRHGKCVVYCIDCQSMVKDGYKFFLSKNGVWLTKSVPVKYIYKNEQ